MPTFPTRFPSTMVGTNQPWPNADIHYDISKYYGRYKTTVANADIPNEISKYYGRYKTAVTQCRYHVRDFQVLW